MTALAALIAGQAWSQAKTTSLDTEVASVELIRRTPISLKQLKLDIGRIETLTKKPMSQQARADYLDLMIKDILFMQYCEREKITVSDAEINQVIVGMKSQVLEQVKANPASVDQATLTNWASTGTIPDESFYAILQSLGVQAADLKTYVKKRLLLQKYMATRKKEIEALPRPTYDEIEKYYNEHSADLLRPYAVKLSIIYVDTRKLDEAAKRKAKELAESLYSKVKGNPTKFNEMVLRSLEKGSGYVGTPEYMYADDEDFRKLFGEHFYKAAMALKANEISPLLSGDNGYHILKAVETYPSKQLELTDPITLGEKGTVYEYIGNLLYTERTNAATQKILETLLNELRAKAKVKVKTELLNW